MILKGPNSHSHLTFGSIEASGGGGGPIGTDVLYSYTNRGLSTGLGKTYSRVGIVQENDTGGTITGVRVSFNVNKSGSPTGLLYGELYAATTGSPLRPVGSPGTPLATASETYNAASLPTTRPAVGNWNVVFTMSGLSLAPSSYYAFVMYGADATTWGTSDYVFFGRDSVSPIANAHQAFYNESTNSWDAFTSFDIEGLIEY